MFLFFRFNIIKYIQRGFMGVKAGSDNKQAKETQS